MYKWTDMSSINKCCVIMHATACFRNIAWTLFPVSKSMPYAQLRRTSAILSQCFILVSKCLPSRPNTRAKYTSALSWPMSHTRTCFGWTCSYFLSEYSRRPRGVMCVLNETAHIRVKQFWSSIQKRRHARVHLKTFCNAYLFHWFTVPFLFQRFGQYVVQ
jgi:hypothetical protein